MFERHWAEIATTRGRPLAPRYVVYLEMEAKGECLLVTLRDAERIVGYWIGFLGAELHQETTLAATTDMFYLDPSVRGGTAALRLFRMVEKVLKSNGVAEWFTDVPLTHDSGRLFVALGHKPVAQYYCKWLEA